MKRFSWSISKYILQAILPYFVFSWLLLSVILFVQQASRYSEIFFSISIPQNLVWQLTLALIPNVIAFTCPMAALIGVIIGLSKLQSDSELAAIRAAGVGNLQISAPIVLLGIVLSLFTFVINLYGVPFAAQLVRKVALQTALYKLESPIEPGVFNTEVNGYTIYVKDSDFNNGTWKNIFIYNEDKENNSSRLITSKSGRVDTNGETSELWLENAIITTFSQENNRSKFASENVGQIRFAIKTKRDEIVEKISKTEQTPEELGLTELAVYANNKEGKEKTEAQILWQRRLLLSITPLIFALLGTALILRFNRSGRGFGIFLGLISLVAYYLIALLGEQLARTNKISVSVASFLPVVISLVIIVWFYFSNRYLTSRASLRFSKKIKIFPLKFNKFPKTSFQIRLKTGILDFDVVFNLLKYLFLTLAFLTSIYLIFTAFELWKFAGEISGGFSLLVTYLFFLLPFIYIQLAPSAIMIAMLATFIIKSRQNEIVTWTAAGQSVYRLLLPGFILMITIGFLNWGIQEKVLPTTNKIQDEFRAKIRSRGILAKKEGKSWVANDLRIYSFEIEANDNSGQNQKINNLTVYEFSPSEPRLQAIYKTPTAVWEKDKIKLTGLTEKILLIGGKAESSQLPNLELAEATNPFNNLYQKPSHLNSKEMREQINDTESETEKKSYAVALEKKYATLVLPFIVTLITAPFALSLSRKGKVITVGYAVGFWLLFMGITNTFEQFGLNGYISPSFAVWSPLILFTLVGTFLLSKVRT